MQLAITDFVDTGHIVIMIVCIQLYADHYICAKDLYKFDTVWLFRIFADIIGTGNDLRNKADVSNFAGVVLFYMNCKAI